MFKMIIEGDDADDGVRDEFPIAVHQTMVNVYERLVARGNRVRVLDEEQALLLDSADPSHADPYALALSMA